MKGPFAVTQCVRSIRSGVRRISTLFNVLFGKRPIVRGHRFQCQEKALRFPWRQIALAALDGLQPCPDWTPLRPHVSPTPPLPIPFVERTMTPQRARLNVNPRGLHGFGTLDWQLSGPREFLCQ